MSDTNTPPEAEKAVGGDLPGLMSVQQAMSEVMRRVTAVGREGVNQRDNYRFRSIDDFMNALNPAMSAAGLVLSQKVEGRTVEDRPRQSGNGTMRWTTVEVLYTFHGPDGSTLTWNTWGEAMDTSDKGTNKALVAAYKYMLMQAFVVPTADIGRADADKDSPEAAYVHQGQEQAPSRQDQQETQAEVQRLRVDLLRATEEPDDDTRGRKIDALEAEAKAGHLLDMPVPTPAGWRGGNVPAVVKLGVLFMGARRFGQGTPHGEDLPLPEQNAWDSHPAMADDQGGVEQGTGGDPVEGSAAAAAEEAPAAAAATRTRRTRASKGGDDQ